VATRSLVVQCLTEEDRQAAAEILGRKGPVEWTGAYATGSGDDEEVAALEARGLMVEQLAPRHGLAWLEPEPEDEAADVAAADAGPASPVSARVGTAPEVYVVQLAGPMCGSWETALAGLGVAVGSYVPDFAFKTALTGEQRAAVEALPFVSRVVHYSPRHTLRRLRAVRRLQKEEGPVRARARRAAGAPPPTVEWRPETAPGAPAEPQDAPAAVEETYEVRCHEPRDVAAVAEGLRRDPRARDVVEGRRRVRFTCDAGSPLVQELARLPQVSSVDLFQPPELAADFVRLAVGISPNGQPALPWDGSGQVVAVADSGVDETHPDLAGRVVKVIERVPPEAPHDPHGHGTHVAGILAGEGQASGGRLRGVAPGTRLVVQSLRDASGRLSGIPIDLGTLFQEAYDEGARIHNDSWGVMAGGLYTLDAYEVDEFVYEHPDMLVVFAAGNRGAQPPEPDEIGRIGYGSLQSPAGAKNVLTVGASCSGRTDGPFAGLAWKAYPAGGPQRPKPSEEPICGDLTVLAAFSSRGPTDDERIKPDLVAPGTAVLAPLAEASDIGAPDGRYTYLSGTSMAAPVVAGAAAIVRQYYLDVRGHLPSAALLKATLINGTVWIERDTVVDGVGRPNFHQGFGRLDLRETLPTPGGVLKLAFADVARDTPEALRKEAAERASWKRTVAVEPGLRLRVTLVWTDRPAHGLQQDLDLVLVTPSGQRIPGNPGLARGPWAKTDHRNNVEQIVLDAPEAGQYRIAVLAYNTLFEPQGFALVVTGKLGSDLLP
jgi:subtilisin family serine protease